MGDRNDQLNIGSVIVGVIGVVIGGALGYFGARVNADAQIRAPQENANAQVTAAAINVYGPISITQTVEAARRNPTVLLGRLQVTFLGINSDSLIGSGCPGDDGRGSILNYHLRVEGVSSQKQVTRMVVLGNVGTDTWEWPCSNAWALLAKPESNGESWEIYVAVANPQTAYTVIIFYDDESIALGTAIVPT